MSLKTAIIVGIVGATLDILLTLLPLAGGDEVKTFLWGTPLGNIFYAIPELCYLFFFVTLLIKQK